MSKIDVRTVLQDYNDLSQNSLQGFTFVIKEYQRGYRWDKTQIEALLEDIYEFKTQDGELKYCLQPLVVKELNESLTEANRLSNFLENETASDKSALKTNRIWELIDGQQRLTTILLILHSCYSITTTKRPLPYEIIYVNHRDIDDHYIKKAKEVIEAWFEKFGMQSVDVKLEISKKIHSNVQFIWYETDKNVNSSEIFTKINMGKIPLTNAELFKALLLNHDNAIKNNRDVEIQLAKISFEWDTIEQSLRDDEFWFFIANELKDTETRIDYLLNLYASTHSSLVENELNNSDELYPFLVVSSLVKQKIKSVFEIWDEIARIYDTLKEWFSDKYLYHEIGFLITVSGKTVQTINDLIGESMDKKKSQFKNCIKSRIKAIFKNVDIDDLDYNSSSDKKSIRNVLLYFNIYTMIQSDTESRFSFRQFKDARSKWDIEHIHARATEEELLKVANAESKSERNELLNGLRNQLKYINEVETVKEIEKFMTSESEDLKGSKFIEFYNRISDIYGDFVENGIGNLVLLDSGTNRAYKNALFAYKRQMIIEKDKGEVFIPVCTKNVFLKMYSDGKGLSNMLQWSYYDAQCYIEAIKKTLIEEAGVCQSEKK